VRRPASNVSVNGHGVYHREKGENVNGVFLVYRDVSLCHVGMLAKNRARNVGFASLRRPEVEAAPHFRATVAL